MSLSYHFWTTVPVHCEARPRRRPDNVSVRQALQYFMALLAIQYKLKKFVYISRSVVRSEASRVTQSYKTTKRFLRPRDGDYESRASSDTTKALATELQLEQFTVWANRELSPASVFEKLELKSETVSPFGGPVFEAWVGYVRKLHGRNEDAATSTMVEALRNVYGPRELALLLFEAKGILDPKLTAGGLRAKQYKLWMWISVDETNFLTRALKSNSRRLTETEKKILNEYLQFVEAYKTKHYIRAGSREDRMQRDEMSSISYTNTEYASVDPTGGGAT
ncbi:hypothetical protein GQ600_17099 [Phytophthora cactorum]|nr:hypothetical protein GQ600_17099 [Phytophthora cactorum]